MRGDQRVKMQVKINVIIMHVRGGEIRTYIPLHSAVIHQGHGRGRAYRGLAGCSSDAGCGTSGGVVPLEVVVAVVLLDAMIPLEIVEAVVPLELVEAVVHLEVVVPKEAMVPLEVVVPVEAVVPLEVVVPVEAVEAVVLVEDVRAVALVEVAVAGVKVAVGVALGDLFPAHFLGSK